ncbi:MAG: DUF5668 domain-containing protein [Patescibacteria group bacterium]|nr:DUF5668 domain-containing protein [Patescibacteria group bacterium]
MPKPKKEVRENKTSEFGKLFTEAREEFWQADQREEEKHIHNHYYNINKPRKINFGKVAMGVLLIILGFIYLSVNMGWLPEETKPDLWKLWPVLIIFWGLSMMAGRSLASIIAGTIITLTVIAAVMLLIFGQTNWQFSAQKTNEVLTIENETPITDYQPDLTEISTTSTSSLPLLP